MTNGSLNSYRFSFWIPLFAGLLILVPVFIWSGFISLAKIDGFAVLLLLLVAMRKWFSLARTNNNRVERIQLSANDLFLLQQIIPSFKNWPAAEQRILVDQIGLFLAEVQFKGTWTSKAQFTIGVAVALATWDHGYINKQQWVLCTSENDTYYIDQNPTAILKTPVFASSAKSLSALLDSESVLALKKVIQGL
jgi:Ca2+/Na+ antiporter